MPYPDSVAPAFTSETMHLYAEEGLEVPVEWTGGSGPYLLEINTNGVIETVEIQGTSTTLTAKADTRIALRVRELNGKVWSEPLFVNVYQPIRFVKITDNLPKNGPPKPGKNYMFKLQIEGGSGRYSYQLWEKRWYQYLDLYTNYVWMDEADETTSKKATLRGQFDAVENHVQLRVRDKITGQIVTAEMQVDLTGTGAAWYDEVAVSVGKVTKKNGSYTVPLSWRASKAGLKPTHYKIYDQGELVKTVGGTAKGAKLTGLSKGNHTFTVEPVLSFGDIPIPGKPPVPVTITIP